MIIYFWKELGIINSMFKLFRNFIFLSIVLIFFLLGCDTKKNTKQDNFVEINTKTFESLLEKKEEHNVYIGRPTCPDCKKFKPILEKNIPKGKKVFYYNTDNRRNEKGFEDIIKKFNVNSVPVVLKIKDKKLLSKLEFTDKPEDINNFLENKKLTYNDDNYVVKGTEKVSTKNLSDYINGNSEKFNDGFLYFSGIDCNSCKIFDNELEVLLKKGFDSSVYYFDIPDSENKDINKILDYYNIENVPVMLKLESGIVVDKTLDKKELENFMDILN